MAQVQVGPPPAIHAEHAEPVPMPQARANRVNDERLEISRRARPAPVAGEHLVRNSSSVARFAALYGGSIAPLECELRDIVASMPFTPVAVEREPSLRKCLKR